MYSSTTSTCAMYTYEYTVHAHSHIYIYIYRVHFENMTIFYTFVKQLMNNDLDFEWKRKNPYVRI